MTSILHTLITRKAALIAGLALIFAAAALTRLAWLEGLFIYRAPSVETTLPVVTAKPPPRLLSPLAFVHDTNTVLTLTDSPFTAPAVDTYLARLAANEVAAELARVTAMEAARKAAADRAATLARAEAADRARAEAAARIAALKTIAPPTPHPPPPPAMVRFLYQGLFQLADQRPLALIAVGDLETRAAPYAPGESCRGAVVTNITADTVSLILADGSVRQAESGRPELIRKDSLHGQHP